MRIGKSKPIVLCPHDGLALFFPCVSLVARSRGANEITGGLFTPFHVDTPDGRRFLQLLNGQFLCFALIFSGSPQNSCSFDPIYYYLVTILPGHAFIHSADDLSTTNVLVPVVVYLARNEGKFPDDKELRRFMHWMYAASMWGRYSSQTDQKLDHDISIVQRSDSPWKELVDAIIEQRGRIEVKPSDLEGRGIQHPLYRMMFIIAKTRNAVDWFNGSPLSSPHGSAYAINNRYIFPNTLLYKSYKYNPENHRNYLGLLLSDLPKEREPAKVQL